MTAYRLFGTETSSYSMKVRAFLRYKKADYDWVLRSQETEEEFQRHASLPSIPLLIDPKGKASQDSTNILANLEKGHNEPSARPDDTGAAAIALLLEDYADEWLNKAMFYMRWMQSPDNSAAARRVLEQMLGGKRPAKPREARAMIAEKMVERLSMVGATEANGEFLVASFRRFAELFNAHLEKHLYIFGGRPCVADFAIAAQVQQMLNDPTAGEWLRDRAPFLTAWCEFMEDPRAGAPFLSLEDVSETLLPVLRDEVAITFIPWAEANSKAMTKRKKDVSVTLDGHTYEQGIQRYAVKSWRDVKKTVGSEAKSSKVLKKLLKDAKLNKAF